MHVATLRRRFAALEKELGDGPFFNGEHFALVDAAFAPVFRYLGTVDREDELGFYDGLTSVNRWRKALAERRSVKAAVVGDYPERLRNFLSGMDTVLGHRLGEAPSKPL